MIETYLRKAFDVHPGEAIVPDIAIGLCNVLNKLMSFTFLYLLNYSRLIAT